MMEKIWLSENLVWLIPTLIVPLTSFLTWIFTKRKHDTIDLKIKGDQLHNLHYDNFIKNAEFLQKVLDDVESRCEKTILDLKKDVEDLSEKLKLKDIEIKYLETELEDLNNKLNKFLKK